MKSILTLALLNFLLIAESQAADFIKPAEEQSTQAAPILHIEKELTLLNHIAFQSQTIIELIVTNEEYALANVKDTISSIQKLLDQLMNDLDPYIKDIIFEEINIITQTTVENIAQSIEAYKILVSKIEAINAKAQVAKTAKKAAQAVNDAPDEKKQMVLAQQKQKILAAEQQAQKKGMMSRLKSQVFGEETSWAKAAFYTAAGAATIGALYYGYQNAENIGKKIHTSWWDLVKRTTGYKSPLDYFMQDIGKLNKITTIAYEAEKQFIADPTPENEYILKSVAQLYNQQSDNVENTYQHLTPGQQKEAEQIADKMMGSLQTQ